MVQGRRRDLQHRRRVRPRRHVEGRHRADATALLTIVDAGTYAPLVDAILAAIPSSWYTDDPDYVDSWYTLSTTSGGHLNGAAANGWMDVSPYYVQPL